MTTTHELSFETPARNQGQIVTYSYAYTRRGAKVVSRHDGSDNSLSFYWAKTGRTLSEASMAKYGLVSRG